MAGCRNGEAGALVHSGGHSASEDSAVGSSAELPGSRRPPTGSGLRRRLASGAVAAATTVLLLVLLGQQGSGGALLKNLPADEGAPLQLAKVDSRTNVTGKLYVVGHGGCAVSSNYTWKAPYTGVVRVLVVGAGGGGSSGTEGGGAGGDGGSVSEKDFNVTAGENFTVIIGEGGSGGEDDETPGEDGGDSAFEDLTAQGGRGGQIGRGGGKGGQCFADCPVGNGSLAMVSVPDFAACLKGSPQMTVSDVEACVNKARRTGTVENAETISAATQVNLTQFSVCMEMTFSSTSDSVTDCLNTSMGAPDGGECGIGGRGIMSCVTGECIAFGGGGGAGSDAHECGGVDTGGVGGGGRGGAPGAEPDGRPGADGFGGGGGGGGATARNRGAHGGDGGKGIVILKYLMIANLDTNVPDTPVPDMTVARARARSRALAASNSDDVSNENDEFCNSDQFCVFPDMNGLGQILCRNTVGEAGGRCPGQGDPEFPTCTPGEKKACACEQKLEGGVQQKTCMCPKEGDCFYAVPPEECAASGQKFCAFPEISSPSKILCRALDGKCPKPGDPEFTKCTPGEKQACACEIKLTGDVQQKTCDCPDNGDCFFAVPPVAGADDGNETAENQSNGSAEVNATGYKMYMNFCATAEDQDTAHTEIGAYDITKCLALCTKDPACSAVEHGGVNEDEGVTCFHILSDIPATQGSSEAQHGDARCYVKIDFVGSNSSSCNGTNGTEYEEFQNFCVDANGEDTDHTKIGDQDPEECKVLCSKDPKCSAVEWGGVDEDEGHTCFHIRDGPPAVRGSDEEQHGDAKCFVKRSCDNETSNETSSAWTIGASGIDPFGAADLAELAKLTPSWCKADEVFDCAAGYNNWKAGWSLAKMRWCCEHYELSCDDKPFDCEEGQDNWEAAWSLDKIAWCCESEGKGCGPDGPFDCEAGYSNWEAGWSKAKKVWCCEQRGKGCEESAAEDFDCDAGFANWKAGWSPEKKAFCCEQVQMGCEGTEATDDLAATTSTPSTSTTTTSTTTTSAASTSAASTSTAAMATTSTTPSTMGVAEEVEFDCDAGLSNWEAGWTDAKKTYCCERAQKGCKTEVEFDCDAGFSNWEAGWSDNKKEYCCKKAQKGCKEDEFDCDAGYSNWRAGWSEAKQAYCCEKAQKGCVSGAPFDCDAGLLNWEAGWSYAKKAYCCEKEQKGCAISAPFGSFYCDEGYSNWEAGWSDAKKAYCCEVAQKGCAPFDCDAGFSNWKEGWSDAKKKYCCEQSQRGCEAEANDKPPFDCLSDVAGGKRPSADTNYWYGWSEEKKTFCCKWEEMGCVKDPFDCDADLKTWSTGWSDKKKEWCCKVYKRGC